MTLSDVKMTTYFPRIADSILASKLKSKGAVLIEGPKWCGKTTTAKQIAASALLLANPDTLRQSIRMMELQADELLDGAVPRLIDEWQTIPQIWDAVRNIIDERSSTGQFILTGSAVPADTSEIIHTGTGRFTSIRMRPMSLFESGESNGEIRLSNLFTAPEKLHGKNTLNLNNLAYLICRGGWPGAIRLDEESSLEQAFDYVDAVINSDISRADGVTRKPERTARIMKSLARNQGTQAPATLIRDDISRNEAASLNEDTVSSYISALKMIFVIEDMPAWNPNLRSKTAIRTTDTRYFIDPSIASASLGLGPEDLMKDLKTFGFLFETLCVRDLRVYADTLKGSVYHYRDKSNLECDAVIHLRNGRYGLVEIKLGGNTLIEEGAKNLLSVAKKIDTEKMNSPAFLMVLVGTGEFAYRRNDGVYVVPVGCLGP